MSLVLSTRRAIGAPASYIDKVIGLGPIAYWPLNEGSGTTAACQINPAQNGTYTGVTLANDATGSFGTAAPFFDGANDYVNIYSLTLANAWNTPERSMMVWAKVNGAGVWTDGATRAAIDLRGVVGTDNYIQRKDNVNNRLDWLYRSSAGGILQTRSEAGVSTTDWMCLIFTVSVASNQAIAYRNGSQVGAALAGILAWGGLLGATQACVGAQNTTPADVWHGWCAHAALWNRVLPSAEVTALANP